MINPALIPFPEGVSPKEVAHTVSHKTGPARRRKTGIDRNLVANAEGFVPVRQVDGITQYGRQLDLLNEAEAGVETGPVEPEVEK